MKILVCTDGSESSNNAVKKAAKIAALFKRVQITVINVIEPIYTPPPYGVNVAYSPNAIPSNYLHTEIKKEGMNILAEAAKIIDRKNVKLNTLLLSGHPTSTIADYASNHDFNLLVIGNKGRRALEGVLMGSVSSAVVQKSDCDVLVVK